MLGDERVSTLSPREYEGVCGRQAATGTFSQLFISRASGVKGKKNRTNYRKVAAVCENYVYCIWEYKCAVIIHPEDYLTSKREN